VHADFLKTFRFWADRGVSGFRIDVAHGMVKDMSEPLLSHAEMDKLWKVLRLNGNEPNLHPLWDRVEVHDIYKSWRKVFNEYDPPLT
jgi:alpha-glucosidase